MNESQRITTADALATIDDERAKWNGLVDEVGPDRMETPGAAGDWTFKDVSAHLSFWMEKIILTLEAVANEEPVDIPDPWPVDITDPEGVNQWAYHQSKDRSIDDVLAEADEGYSRIRRALEIIPEETLNSTDIFDWQNDEPFAQWLIDRRLFNHYYREHQPVLREWLDERRSYGPNRTYVE